MLTVITGWSPSGWDEYGRLFVHTFERYWPADVALISYVETPPPPTELPRTKRWREFRLLDTIPEARKTLAFYDNPQARGRVPAPSWKRGALEAGYNWRFDAWKFCRQGLIPLAAAQQLDRGDLLLWLDGDVQTTRAVPAGFIETLLPVGYDVAYLGREPKHSEIGFQLYRIPHAVPMLAEFQSLFVTGGILREQEWHSAYAWDIARVRSGVRAHNLTPGGSGHVWQSSVLERYMTHNKGDRKIAAARAYFTGIR